MSEHHDDERRTGDAAITENTKVDLKTLILVVTGVLGLAGAMTRSEFRVAALEADLNAKIVEVRNAAERDKGETNYRLTNLEKATCAIAKKVGAGDSGCP